LFKKTKNDTINTKIFVLFKRSIKMEYEKRSYLKQGITLLLLAILFLTLFEVKLPQLTTGGNNNLAGFVTDVRLEVVTLDETERLQMNWTEVAQMVMPSVVAITSFDTQTGQTSSGSGVILSEDGLIITNAHVVSEEDNELTVILPDDTGDTAQDNERYEATLIGLDNYTDLAVIKIDAQNLTPAEFGSSEELLIAQGVMAVGYPGGLDLSPSATVTIGYISAIHRPVDMGNGYVINSIQTDAAINPGNSGGALVNAYGQVIGIPSSKIVATGYEGLGFAIPTVIARNIVNDLIQFGYVQNRATIGVGGVVYNEYYAQFYSVPVGLLVQEIYAQNTLNSGLQVGDRITKVETVVVNSINIVNYYLQQKMPGDSLQIEVYRDGNYINLNILLSDFNEVYHSQ
jgi:serine protease Do